MLARPRTTGEQDRGKLGGQKKVRWKDPGFVLRYLWAATMAVKHSAPLVVEVPPRVGGRRLRRSCPDRPSRAGPGRIERSVPNLGDLFEDGTGASGWLER